MTVRLFDPADEGDSPLTVGQIVTLYLDHAPNDLSPRTLERRLYFLRTLRDDLGALPLDEAKPYDLRKWIAAQDSWKSNWTKRSALLGIQRAFNWAVNEGLTDRNPFRGVSHPEGELGRAMTGPEFCACLRNSTTPFRRVLLFLRLTGCRPGELSAIEPKHVDFGRGVVSLDKHKARRLQKRKRPRVIVLHPTAARLLAYLIRTMAPGQERVFVSSRGNAWTTRAFTGRMAHLRAKLGLPADCRAYGLRHKFGTDAIKNSVGLKTLSVLMGHATTRTTERYVHLEDEYGHLGEAVEKTISPKSGGTGTVPPRDGRA